MEFSLSRLFFICILLLQSACREQILHNLTENDANKLLNRLHQAGLLPEKTKQADGKWAISVEKKEALSAISLLEENRALKRFSLPLIEAPGMFASTAEKKFNLYQVLAGNIEESLASLRGVLEAHVHLFPGGDYQPWEKREGAGFKESASVLLIVSGEFKISAEDIKKIVAGAAGLEEQSIAIVLNSASAEEDLSKQFITSAPGEDSKVTILKLEGSKNYSKYLSYFMALLLFVVCLLIRRQAHKVCKIRKDLIFPEISNNET